MRIHILFLTLFSLLCLTRMGDMVYSFSQYRVTSSLESLFSGAG